MAARDLPEAAYLRECLDYNPDTGEFRWKERPPWHFRSTAVCRTWNGKWAGKLAGTGGPLGYRVIGVNSVTLKAHRLAWVLMHGAPVPAALDHKDGDPSNNRITNLRIASLSDNAANKRTHSNSRTGIKGVSLFEGGRYRAVIRRHGIRVHLGLYETLEEAIAARRTAADRLHGEFARHS